MIFGVFQWISYMLSTWRFSYSLTMSSPQLCWLLILEQFTQGIWVQRNSTIERFYRLRAKSWSQGISMSVRFQRMWKLSDTYMAPFWWKIYGPDSRKCSNQFWKLNSKVGSNAHLNKCLILFKQSYWPTLHLHFLHSFALLWWTLSIFGSFFRHSSPPPTQLPHFVFIILRFVKWQV